MHTFCFEGKIAKCCVLNSLFSSSSFFFFGEGGGQELGVFLKLYISLSSACVAKQIASSIFLFPSFFFFFFFLIFYSCCYIVDLLYRLFREDLGPQRKQHDLVVVL